MLSRVPAGEVELLSPEKRDYASQNDPKLDNLNMTQSNESSGEMAN